MKTGINKNYLPGTAQLKRKFLLKINKILNQFPLKMNNEEEQKFKKTLRDVILELMNRELLNPTEETPTLSSKATTLQPNVENKKINYKSLIGDLCTSNSAQQMRAAHQEPQTRAYNIERGEEYLDDAYESMMPIPASTAADKSLGRTNGNRYNHTERRRMSRKSEFSKENIERKLQGVSRVEIKPALCEFKSTGKGVLTSILEVKAALTKIGKFEPAKIGPIMKLGQRNSFLVMIDPAALLTFLERKDEFLHFELCVWNVGNIGRNIGAIAICSSKFEKIPSTNWRRISKEIYKAATDCHDEEGILRLLDLITSSEKFNGELLTKT